MDLFHRNELHDLLRRIEVENVCMKKKLVSKLTFVTLENVFAAIVTNSRIRWYYSTASWALQAFRHAGDSFVKIFIFKHQVGCCNRQ